MTADRQPRPLVPAPLPPHDLGAEEAVVAALLLDEAAVYRVIGQGLQPADFYDDLLGQLYAASVAVAERGELVTMITVANEAYAAVEALGGLPVLVELLGRHFTAVGVEAHCRLVMRDARYRRLISAGQQIVRLGYAGGPDAEATWQSAMAALDEHGGLRNPDVLAIAHYIENELPEEDRVLYTAGFRGLDRFIRGLAEGELITIGARTDAGKTALAVGMMYRQALAGVPTAYIPLEGSVGQVMHRMAAIRAQISPGYAARHGWREDEEAAYFRHYANLHDLPIYFPDQKHVPRSVHAITSWITRAARGNGIKVAYIDHIDAVVLERERGQSGASAYAEAMKQLQELAGRERIAVVIASQVNRMAREAELIPPMSLLRESGAKEEASQTVLMVGLESGRSPTLHPYVGRMMHVMVAKLKDYPGQRLVTAANTDRPVLFLDERSGAVREIAEELGDPVKIQEEMSI